MSYRSYEQALEALETMYKNIADADRDEVFISLLSEQVARAELEKICELLPDAPLSGLVLAVKDNIDVEGFVTTAACPGFLYKAEVDAGAVRKLKEAGALVIGKTNLDQFATGLVGTRSPYGVVRDTRRPEFISGGSSSGSAAAVALSFVDAALGTDTAGSGRIPAGLQGIVGIKATLGAVSTDGVVPACESYDCVTVFAPDLDLAETVMGCMSTSGERTWPADTRMTAPLTPALGIPSDLPELSGEWRRAFDRAVREFGDLGCEIKTIDLGPSIDAAKMLYESALVAERYEAVGEYIVPAGSDAGLDPTVEGIVTAAGRWTGTEVLAAQRELARRRTAAMAEWECVDAVLVPTAPFHPTIEEVQADPVGVNARMGTYTNFCNLFDLCGVAVPAGEVTDATGTAQFGVTVLARPFEDGVAADIAGRLLRREISDADGGWVAKRQGAHSHTITVFGAHLRGQPLNHQLRDCGAAFIGDVTTANHRLYALDTAPPKPGLVPADDGSQIAGEEWLISSAGLGSFLAGLPQPMTMGEVVLSDGRHVLGFSCQPSAIDGARDITEFGGWRAFLQSES